VKLQIKSQYTFNPHYIYPFITWRDTGEAMERYYRVARDLRISR